MQDKLKKLAEYIDSTASMYHKNCTDNDFDNGAFWALKDLKAFMVQELQLFDTPHVIVARDEFTNNDLLQTLKLSKLFGKPTVLVKGEPGFTLTVNGDGSITKRKLE